MKTMYKNFAITATYKGDKRWNCSTTPNYNNYLVTVRNMETGKFTRFDFWQSINEPRMKSEWDAKYAFRCFLDDALSGIQYNDIDEFSKEFGYDRVSECYKAWKGCLNAARKAKRVIGDENTLCDLINAMSDEEIW